MLSRVVPVGSTLQSTCFFNVSNLQKRKLHLKKQSPTFWHSILISLKNENIQQSQIYLCHRLSSMKTWHNFVVFFFILNMICICCSTLLLPFCWTDPKSTLFFNSFCSCWSMLSYVYYTERDRTHGEVYTKASTTLVRNFSIFFSRVTSFLLKIHSLRENRVAFVCTYYDMPR